MAGSVGSANASRVPLASVTTVVAGVSGACAGFGLSLMMACDLAVVAEGATLRCSDCGALERTRLPAGAADRWPALVALRAEAHRVDRATAVATRDSGGVEAL